MMSQLPGRNLSGTLSRSIKTIRPRLSAFSRTSSFLNKTVLVLVTASLTLGPNSHSLFGQTIAEKKASLSQGSASKDLSPEMQKFLLQVNNELKEHREILKELYGETEELYNKGAPPDEWKKLLDEVKLVRGNILVLEESWRKMAEEHNQQEDYALWHQPDTTLGDLVIDYGSSDYVYMITPEIASIPISINSNIAIPRSSWTEMLTTILSQNGVGIKELNPYLRSLYLTKEDFSTVKELTNKRESLELLAPYDRILYILSPNPLELRRVFLFLDKFVDRSTTDLQTIGRDILITGPVQSVQELLKLYDFVEKTTGGREYKVIALRKTDPEEMAKVLSEIFGQFSITPEQIAQGEGGRESGRGEKPDSAGLKVIGLSHLARAIILIGTKEEIKKGEDIIYQVESEVGESLEKIVFTYNCKHTDPKELADILEKVYLQMISSNVILGQEGDVNQRVNQRQNVAITEINNPERDKLPEQLYHEKYYEEGTYAVNPAPVQPNRPREPKPDPNKGKENFFVDPKTGAIVMVVEALAVPKLKELIRKLDVPKKMVQIEVLLFEKRMEKENSFGLNLLRIGTNASQTNKGGVSFNDIETSTVNEGIFRFFLSQMKHSWIPAYDFAYKFLLSCDDVTINASPSVVTMNQTKATININEEISLNTGVFEVETVKGVTLKDAFTRAQYGITIDVTPTVHMRSNDDGIPFGEEADYVSMETDIFFQTIQPGSDPSRPNVITRHIDNVVRIPDGQTVILGGLRRKISSDQKDSIPFFGELPGIGKLFSNTVLKDSSVEMFIFLTPKIISDPQEDFARIRSEEMTRRPGDIPGFMKRLVLARECEKNRLMEGYMTMLFGRERERFYYRPGEYYGH